MCFQMLNVFFFCKYNKLNFFTELQIEPYKFINFGYILITLNKLSRIN